MERPSTLHKQPGNISAISENHYQKQCCMFSLNKELVENDKKREIVYYNLCKIYII